MTVGGEALAVAMRHHQSGDLQTAERLYREILTAEPSNADALHLLGVIALQSSQAETAIELIRSAIQLNAKAAPYYGNLGAAYQSLKRSHEAIAAFQQAVKLSPEFQVAHANLGRALIQVGDFQAAIAALQRAVQLNGKDIEARVSLGVAWKESGSLDQAIIEYRRVLAAKPDYAQVRTNLGNTLKLSGDVDAAVAEYERAAGDRPDYPEAHLGLGAMLSDLGRLDEAIACFEQALRLRPDYAEAHINLGNALKQLEHFPAAIESLRRATQLRPDDHEIQLFLAMALKQAGQLEAAITIYERIISTRPDYAEAYGNLGVALQEQGELERAISVYKKALAIKPDFDEALAQQVYQQLQTCSWEDLPANMDRVIAAASEDDSPISPFLVLTLPSSPAIQHQCAQRWAGRVRCPRDRFHFPPPGEGRITIGYLSGDFREHPVANQAVEIFEKHDRNDFCVRAYSFGPDDGSSMRSRLRKAFDDFVDIRAVSFEQAAKRIHADGVDILVDMMGYTRLARTQIVAMRPAPIQVNYLGFPGTMGANFVDYVIADEFVLPSEQQLHFSERIVHLPGSFLAADSQREVAQKFPSRSEAGLPEKGFVFCCFNQSRKIRPDVFDVWMRLLKQVPDSVLWLPKSNRFATQNLKNEATARGVDATRVVFAAKVPTVAEHLARVRCADLFVDTWPYNAHASASDALWVGCPILTFPGETFASRVAGSLLRAAGLPELIANSAEQYEQTALELARDPDRLAAIRSRLTTARETSPLFDGARFARHLEAAYRRMWERYRTGKSPEGFVAGVEPRV